MEVGQGGPKENLPSGGTLNKVARSIIKITKNYQNKDCYSR